METILATKSNATDYRPLKWVLVTVSFITFFAKVNLPNTNPEINTSSTKIQPVKEVITAYTGTDVYNMACIACHTDGIAGSPRISDIENWKPRIAKGVNVLRINAINGYTGSSGYMPPKGGRLDLSNEDIHKAIDYMLTQIGN